MTKRKTRDDAMYHTKREIYEAAILNSRKELDKYLTSIFGDLQFHTSYSFGGVMTTRRKDGENYTQELGNQIEDRINGRDIGCGTMIDFVTDMLMDKKNYKHLKLAK